MSTQTEEISISLKFVVKPYNIDASGHVNNAVYINWLEDLRDELFEKIIPINELISKGLYLVVASTIIEYKKPIFLFDKPEGTMRVDKYIRGIWYLSAEIELEGKIAAKVKQKCVLFDRETKKMIHEKNYF
jgi:acyl-CoA thioester hydrolase